MKPVLTCFALFFSALSFSAHANQDCYFKATEKLDNIIYLAEGFNGSLKLLNNFNQKTREALQFSLVLASGNTPPNNYMMSMVNDANMMFNGLSQRADTNSSLSGYINFSKLKNEFNACLSEEVKLRCPQTISSFNYKITSLVSNQDEANRQNALLADVKNQVFSVLKSDYENKIVMTPEKIYNFTQNLQQPYMRYKMSLEGAQGDAALLAS
ncbi:hypothetical protein C0V70_04350 [Bacteriovorax stolpii]|uniref:Uncharacterized protein n=1 Tax=Bacteriovorax stolpii TaxID=960 RepID=A0A2K9NPC5_BACTC|nr:hypothetical protein [Bacteriovorax stolpii]AUN97353.1 hypothetical protein C0V70_04350 [Bacteriovorax stolpii]TDP52524.1 hypothetical protein C8D79_2289 [Bacteriovorax stolpii]